MGVTTSLSMDRANSYDSRVRDETARYASCLEVHRLPPIFHYWSDRYVRPKLQAAGFESPDGMFRDSLRRICLAPGAASRKFLSVGAGNCDLEIETAASLRSHGCGDFTIECLELNGAMLERGQQAAAAVGVAEHLQFTQADFNQWTANRSYDAVMANQSLHHVLNLEGLLDQVEHALTPDGLFLISDMIGRNGHQRWPEALAIVEQFWRRLPPSYRYNQALDRYEEMYQNWDCAQESFEGIRAQDILPLLLDRFHPHVFIGFANVIDVFTDRAFGFHFDAERGWDRRFIDEVHQRDELEIRTGRLTPTHMVAIFGRNPAASPQWNPEPRKCVRRPDAQVDVNRDVSPYEWHSWPHAAEAQLEIVCGYLARSRAAWEKVTRLEFDLIERTEWARRLEALADERAQCVVRLDQELRTRTEWAAKLDRDLEERAAIIRTLQRELEERTEWARSLERESEARGARVRQLDRELEERTAWARRLDGELDHERGIRQALEAELHSPRRVASRMIRFVRDRILRPRTPR